MTEEQPRGRLVLSIAEDISKTLNLDTLKCLACKLPLKEPRYLPCDHVLCSSCYKSHGSSKSKDKSGKSLCPVSGCGTQYDPNKAKTSLDVNLGRSLRFFTEMQKIIEKNAAVLEKPAEEIPMEVDEDEAAKENVHITTTSVHVPPAPISTTARVSDASTVERCETASSEASSDARLPKPKKEKAAAKEKSAKAAPKARAKKQSTGPPATATSGPPPPPPPPTVEATAAAAASSTTSVVSAPAKVSLSTASDSTTTASDTSRAQSVESSDMRSATPPSKQAAALDKRNPKGETALQRACKKKNSINEVRKLLDAGANPNVYDNAGWAPLHEAAQRGDAEVIEALITKGANVNVKSTKEGATPLHDAVSSGSLRAVEVLIKAGANVGLQDFTRKTPLDYAVDDAIKQVLKQAMSKVCQDSVPGQVARDDKESRVVTFAVSGFNSDQTAAYSERLRTMGNMVGRLVDAVTPEVTHLVVSTVADNEKVCARRSLKFLQAVARGCWVVSIKWLEHSLAASVWLPGDDYEVGGCARANPQSGGPKLSRIAHQANKEPPLFAASAVFFQGSFDAPAIEIEQLQVLAEWLGAKVLKREPRAKISLPAIGIQPPPIYHARPESNLRDYCVFVVRDPVLSAIPQQLRSPPVCSVTYDWFLTCIETWKLKDLPSC